uniref:Spindle pole body component n=1 Tax=Albugo laibachii Nc14 TaxID=890382 RepID=F0W1V9_9STRA|nr:gammatubulin complex component 4 putative [Albugo laibachii Nc14]|eukprot:CCA15038.1 gammatubulin complex component 4 putative [Albugo laibachii Nc14]
MCLHYIAFVTDWWNNILSDQMHHELFLALFGHVGDLIDVRSDGYYIRPAISILSDAQKVQVNRLLNLGFNYTILQEFVRIAQTSTSYASVYVTGLSHGIECYLEKYGHKVVQLEESILSSKVVTPIPQLMYELQDFIEIFPELRKLVEMIHPSSCKLAIREEEGQIIEEKTIAGASLLELLHGLSLTGYPRIRKCIHHLQQCCHRILYKQMISWMIYGKLLDPYQEFFVKSTQSNTESGDYHDTLAYRLDLNAIPGSYFPVSIAESIYFIGKSMQILMANGKQSRSSCEVIEKQSHEIVHVMSELAQDKSFDILQVEHAVESIRARVAKHLYQNVVVHANFIQCFDALKQFFLLSRGELYQSFVEDSFSIMQEKPSMKLEETLNHNLWRQTIQDLQLDGDDFAQSTHLQLPLQTFSFRRFNVLDGLEVRNASRERTGKWMEPSQQDASELFYGLLWWNYEQYERYPFSTKIDIQVPSSSELEDSTPWSSKLLILFQDTPVFDADILSRGDTLEFQQEPNTRCLGIELDLRRPDRFASVLIVQGSFHYYAKDASTSGRSSQWKKMEGCSTERSVHIAMHLASGKCPIATIEIQYSRIQIENASNKTQKTYKKGFFIQVNEIPVLESFVDIEQVLDLRPSNEKYWLGLGLGPRLRVAGWSCEKYLLKAFRESNQNLSKNQILPPRELWNHLRLNPKIPWPLPLLFTEDDLQLYNNLFQFCFRLKRIGYALEHTWKVDALRCYSKRNFLLPISALRSRMSYVIQNIQIYFQILVIEANFHKCREEMQASNNFDQVKKFHECFLAALIKQCYIYSRTIMTAMDDILQCCWHFVELISKSGQVNLDSPEEHSKFCSLEQEFVQRLEFFCGVLHHSGQARDLSFLLEYNECFIRPQERH